MSSPVACARPGRRWVFWSAGRLAILVAFSVDYRVTNACFLTSQGTARSVAGWLSKYGDWPKVLLVGLLLVAGLVGLRKIASARLLLLVLAAGLLTGMATIPIHYRLWSAAGLPPK